MSDITAPGRSDARRNARRVQEVALALLAAHGSETTIMDIAREAGVGKATVYRNFPTKAALLAFAAEHHGRWLVEHLETAIAAPDAWEGFIQLVHDTMLRIRTAPILLEALRPHEGPEAAIGSVVADRLAQLVEKLRLAGLVRADLTVDDLGMLIIGCSEYLAGRGGGETEAGRAAELIIVAVGKH